MKRLTTNQRIMLVIGIAAVLIYLSMKPGLFNTIPEDTGRTLLKEQLSKDMDCNKCQKDLKNSITVVNPDISSTYYVWFDGELNGEYRPNRIFEQECGEYLTACYSKDAAENYVCNQDNRIKLRFTCEDQIIHLR